MAPFATLHSVASLATTHHFSAYQSYCPCHIYIVVAVFDVVSCSMSATSHLACIREVLCCW